MPANCRRSFLDDVTSGVSLPWFAPIRLVCAAWSGVSKIRASTPKYYTLLVELPSIARADLIFFSKVVIFSI